MRRIANITAPTKPGMSCASVASAVAGIEWRGYAFAQDPETGCIFNGTAKMAFPYPAADKYTFVNLFAMELLIEGCVDPAYAEYNGRKLRGLAYVDTTQLWEDTLVTTLVVRGPDGYAAVAHRYRRQ